VPTNKQQREAARRQLERKLQQREVQDVQRKQRNLILTVLGTVVLVAVAVIITVVAVSGKNKHTPAAAGSTTPTATATPTSTGATPTPTPTPSVSYGPAKGASVSFDGVTVGGATDLTGYPLVTSKSSTNPTKLEYKDLVVGTGAAATPTSTVTVQYYGVLYKTGGVFDSSWIRGMPAQFPLTGVVPGFTQGIGGTTGVPPMKIGGRRIIILPPALGYGASGQGSIPANASLVFIVDLKSIP
jgi:hypothetical protein